MKNNNVNLWGRMVHFLKDYNINLWGIMVHFMLVRTRRRHFKKVGESLSFSPENSVFRYDSISIGNHVVIGREAIFSCEAEIGNYVMFGPKVYITSGRHEYTIVGKRIREQGEAGVRKVIVEDDSWVGEGSLITRGVVVGEGTVIGGMSVVTKSLPPYCICVGNPCHPIKLRYSDEELREHLEKIDHHRTADEIEQMLERRRQELSRAGYIISEDGTIVLS